jgi:hypothetical protein
MKDGKRTAQNDRLFHLPHPSFLPALSQAGAAGEK